MLNFSVLLACSRVLIANSRQCHKQKENFCRKKFKQLLNKSGNSQLYHRLSGSCDKNRSATDMVAKYQNGFTGVKKICWFPKICFN